MRATREFLSTRAKIVAADEKFLVEFIKSDLRDTPSACFGEKILQADALAGPKASNFLKSCSFGDAFLVAVRRKRAD